MVNAWVNAHSETPLEVQWTAAPNSRHREQFGNHGCGTELHRLKILTIKFSELR